MNRRPVVLALVALSVGACAQPLRIVRSDADRVLNKHSIKATNPSIEGPMGVRTMYYGSGTDRRRREFRDSVTIKTATVDVSPLAGTSDAERKKYWGFGMDSVPINGRVWYPDGQGPFPLVLIVHGNHDMKDYSDPGYEYLGRHLASRGYILVSVDENFINGGIGNENDGRGWLMLKHLEAWKHFNDSAGSPFQGKVDMDNIALMGHSRGGEAVAIATLFNRLTHYPDDAKVRFDFRFNIKSVVAIAPVDGQYDPADQPTPVENVNYLVFHGTHDGDVNTFQGLSQYQRVRFTDGGSYYKAAFLMYRANHGQWNTSWGASDHGDWGFRHLALNELIDPESQRTFAKVVVTAFLESTMMGRREYLPLFRDHRTAGDWLPKTMYWTRFQESGFKPLANYGEDVDVTTGSAPGVTITADSIGIWKEAEMKGGPDGRNKLGHGTVNLGWNNRIEGPDTTKLGEPGRYTINIPDSLRDAYQVGENTALFLSLAPTDGEAPPQKPLRDTTVKKDTATKADSAAKKDTTVKPAKPKPTKQIAPEPPASDTLPVDLSIEVIDANGVVASVPLSRYGPGRRAIHGYTGRRKTNGQSRVTNLDIVLQTYVIPFSDFKTANPSFDPSRLSKIRLTFDRTPAGTVIVSDVGVSNLDPAFLADQQ